MESFDFNIHNYSFKEMEDMIGLASNKKYNANDVALCKQRLDVKLASSGKGGKKMTDFLETVSSCLILRLKDNDNHEKHYDDHDKHHDKHYDKHDNDKHDPDKHDNDKHDKHDKHRDLPQEYYSPAHNFKKNKIIPGTNKNGHFVISDPYRSMDIKDYYVTSGLTVGQSGAPPGTINPVKYTTIATSVNVDSRFRPNYFSTKSSDLYVTLPEKVNNVINYRIGSFEIPFYAIYPVSELNGSNAIKILWNATGHDVPYDKSFILVLPDGNYYTTLDTINVLASVSIENTINTILNSNPDLNGLLYFYLDQISGKGVFAQPSNATPIYFKIVTNVRSNGVQIYDAPLISFLGWQLGFRNAEYISKNSGTHNFGSVVTEALVVVKAANYIFITIDDYNNSVNDYYSAVFAESYAIKNIIARINVGFSTTANDGSSTQLNRQRCFFGPVNIQKLRITLYDNFGRIVDLNNMDWNLELIFECVYD